MRQISRHLTFFRILWLMMAFHIVFVEAEFPEAMEEKPVMGHSISQKKIPTSSFLKKILKSSSEVHDREIQEDVIELPDYTPLGLKHHMDRIQACFYPEDSVRILRIFEIPQFDPDLICPPPQQA